MELMNKQEWDSRWKHDRKTTRILQLFEKVGVQSLYMELVERALLKDVSLDGAEIIELGAGKGVFTKKLIEKNNVKRVVLVDYSSESVNHLRREFSKNKKVEVLQEDVFNLDFDQKFDLVHSHGLIEHFTGEQRQLIISKHAELVKENGLVLVTTPAKSRLDPLMLRLHKMCGFKQEEYTVQELEQRFRRVGLKIVRLKKPLFGIAIWALARKSS